MAKKTRSHFRSSSRALALEPRLLFDGAGAVAAMDAVDGFDHNSHQYDDLFAPQDSRNTVDTRPSEMMESPAAEPASLFIIDASVADY